jgi:pSer/pThr/pTyr-binding forkhead associated (FHA) protein
VRGGDVTVVDMGSTNGVVVDGHRVQQARLEDGTSVVLGNTTVVFHTGSR